MPVLEVTPLKIRTWVKRKDVRVVAADTLKNCCPWQKVLAFATNCPICFIRDGVFSYLSLKEDYFLFGLLSDVIGLYRIVNYGMY